MAPISRLGRALVVGLVAALSVACSGVSGTLPPAPTQASLADYSYLVGAGDTLNVSVARNPELSMMVPVRPDGKISTPLIEDLHVQGKTPAQIGREIETRLSKYVRDPQVTVIVTSFVGGYGEQVRVIGEAVRPQALPFKQRMTLLDVMIAVGGLTDFAAGNRALILRTSEGNKQYSVRVKDLVKNGDISANVEMRPGDVLIIPQSYF